MNRIAVLTEQEARGIHIKEQISRFCKGKGLFPRIEPYQDQEDFFKTVPRAAFGYAVIALPGVAGLNAVEHLRSLCPACRIIWCSDLDFSLHAFRLRVDYFLLEPVTEESLRQGLCVWLEYKAPTAEFQPYYGKQDKEVYHP